MLRTNNGMLQRSASLAVAVLIASTSSWAQESGAKSDDLETVVVTASQVLLPGEYAGGQVARGGRAGMLGNLDLMDSPFTSTNFTAELALTQQAKSVADVLLNDPTVRVARGFGNFQEVYLIRGFPAFSDDMTYNGIYGILPRQFVAAEFVERFELFRGANAFLNGAAPGGSSLGGNVNLVPKRAPKDPLSRMTLGFQSKSAYSLGLDFARRMGANGDTGFRANGVLRGGETSVQKQDRDLTVLSFGVDHLGERFRLSADVGYQDHHIDAPRPSVTPPATGIPRPPDADTNFAFSWNFTDEKQLFAVARGEFDFTDNTTGWAAIGFRDGKEKNVLAGPNSDLSGVTSAFRFDNTRKDSISSSEIGLRTEFKTGSVGHRFILSGSVFSSKFKNAFDFYFTTAANNIYNPMDAAPTTGGFIFRGGLLANPLKTESTDTKSVAIADMISFADDKFLLTIGARNQTIQNDTFDYNTGALSSSYDESRVTPVGGLVYKQSEHWSYYANYIEGLVKGDVAPVTFNNQPVSNAGQALKPYQANQVEVGVKYDSGQFGFTAAAFTLAKPTGIVINQTFVDNGEQRNRGIELSTFGKIGENMRLIGGLTWLDAKMQRTQNGVNQGKTAVGAPDFQLNLNGEWDLAAVQGLTLDARVIYTSDQFADAANAVKVPSWSRFDLGARYATELGGRKTTLRFRIDNLFDKANWISVGGYPGSNYLVLGDPRTFGLSASVDF
jgi:iron complex outermembrane recepter protein